MYVCVYIYIYIYICCANSLQLYPTLCNLMDSVTTAHQAPLSMGFSRQEHWSRLCLPPGDFHNPGIEPVSHVSYAFAGRFFTTSSTWEVLYVYTHTHTHTRI